MAVRVGILALVVYNLVIGVWMVAAPHSFYTAVGPFGPINDHYIRDNATFSLALAAALGLALSRKAWQGPLIAFSALQFALHAGSHLNDISAAHPRWIGAFDFASLTAGAVMLLWLERKARREEQNQ